MKLQRRSLSTIIGGIALALAIITGISVVLFYRVTSSTEENQFFLISSILKSRISGVEDKAQQVGEMVAEIPNVRAYFGARKRDELYAELEDLFKIQDEKYGIENIHFVEPPSTSFLRMRSPAKFGDDLSYKPQVLEAAKAGVMKKGETINRTGPVVYAVVPVRDTTDSLTGCVEVGIAIGPILDKLKINYQLELALYVSEKQLKEVATEVGGDVMNEDNQLGAYYKFHSTNWALMKQLVSASDVTSPEGFVKPYVRSNAGISFGVVLHPLKNFQGDLIGYIAAASDFSASRSKANRTILLMVSGSVLCFILLVGVVLMVIKGGIVRPIRMLSTHYAQLAEGNRDSELEDTSKYFDEIQSLAQSYETLRQTKNDLSSEPSKE